MECMRCRQDMEKREELVSEIIVDVWVCTKCGRKVVDRESMLKQGLVPA